MNKPLHGVRVVEMGSVVLAPYAAQILADLGADVIKVEPPKGDITRNQGFSRHAGMAALYLSCNRGKRSLVLDAKQPEGLAALRRLLSGTDVFLHNLRAATAERLGIGHASVSASNPGLIYCATYGYGAAGRHSDRPAYDDIIQAASGAAGLQATISGTPGYMPTIVADKTSSNGVVSALLIVMIPTVGDYVTPKLVGGKDGMMIANAIQAQFGKASNWPLGAALSVTTMIVVTLMAGAAVFIIRRAARLAR